MPASLRQHARRTLEELEAAGRRRRPVATGTGDGRLVARHGQELLDFSSNDYLGLARDPEVARAAERALAEHGTGGAASRLITGDHPPYAELEAELAALKGTEDAVVFGSGYLANLGILPALVDRHDLILADKLNHACLVDGARLSGARMIRYPHADVAALRARLERYRGRYRHCLLVTDGVFSMDGDLAPLAELSALAAEHDCWLMTDDAHGVGVLGGGAGSTAAARLSAEEVPLQMGTLSKAVGGYGGYLCAAREVADLIRTRARSFIYTTALPPATVAANTAALRRIRTDPALSRRPLELARRLAAGLGLPAPESPIVPVILGADRAALAAQEELAAAGYLVQAIRPPTVPEGTARLRVTLRAPHRESDVDALAGALAPWVRQTAAEAP
ncbi:8-amino-7-oxononanoate synthase [Thiohalorhabdus denitrificans]|uniref:8-amino-7-ketopelargonate synthase n=1 Tax=Thiohalorhabdus denitrificans TaxID=381306 RepID=A0A0P9C994_9GAMM|nr:8-amino-7-oxononanoate synthase [Thiohalorhabdus denitrificans]KPV39716.1 8-amino-7-oxononanoate synthase [Thiohalorhabdus denitrificans]SCX92496.1 8-amino-7-oxononanoate synthase [Thiohalorhabdus denitrificans]